MSLKLVIDVEANSLHNPTKIWCIVTKNLDTGVVDVYRNLTEDVEEATRFKAVWDQRPVYIGHNVLGWDFRHLRHLLDVDCNGIADRTIDTLVLSKLVDYPREGGHSIEDYGKEFGFEKLVFTDFSKLSEEMVKYCLRDVEISEKIYHKYRKVVEDRKWQQAILTEQQFQWLAVNQMHENGFAFDVDKANKLLDKVKKELEILDEEINKFPPIWKHIRTVVPKATKFGTIAQNSLPKCWRHRTCELTVGVPFEHGEWIKFNPASVKQVVDLLWSAGWSPEDRTKTAVTVEREIPRADPSTLEDLLKKREHFKKYGWKVNEHNLNTLPQNAPKAAKTLARRILIEARRRTITEWLNLTCTQIKIEKIKFGEIGIEKPSITILYGDEEKANSQKKDLEICQTKSEKKKDEENISNVLTDYRSKNLIKWLKTKKVDASFVKENKDFVWITVTGQEQLEACYVALATCHLDGMKQEALRYTTISNRIYGNFQGIGAWTHRLSHQKPNMANIPNHLDTQGRVKYLGSEMRSLFIAPKKRLLVGVDAAAIQLRIFAHYINEPAFTKSLIDGKKEDKSDPHSLNQSILGKVCKSRAAAKRYIFALLLGAGIGKLAEILECTQAEADASLQNIMERYRGFAILKTSTIPADAKRGWFYGLDGRKVGIPGISVRDKSHLAMSGYLQNGEAVIMKMATLLWMGYLEKELGKDCWKLVNLVHDEWQTECDHYMDVAIKIAELQDKALQTVGVMLKLNCPLAGSYYDDDRKDYTIGTNWKQTH